jgi:hypothetical protein
MIDLVSTFSCLRSAMHSEHYEIVTDDDEDIEDFVWPRKDVVVTPENAYELVHEKYTLIKKYFDKHKKIIDVGAWELCAFCQVYGTNAENSPYRDNDCGVCPVKRSTGLSECRDTGWYMMREGFHKNDLVQFKRGLEKSLDTLVRVRRMLDQERTKICR